MLLLLSLQLLMCLVRGAAINVTQESFHYKRQAGDSRSPCPAVNTLANHGYMYDIPGGYNIEI
jgi:hypothetical protein